MSYPTYLGPGDTRAMADRIRQALQDNKMLVEVTPSTVVKITEVINKEIEAFFA